MRHETPVAEGKRVTVDDEHTASSAGQRNDMPPATVGVEVAAQ